MKQPPPLLLETPRLLLKAARHEHAPSLYAECTSNAEAARYLQRGVHPSQSRTEAIIATSGEDAWTTTRRFTWSILHRPDDRAIGLFMLFTEDDTAEIHYGLGPAFWGQGLATEAGRAIMAWVIDHSCLPEVSTCCASQHAASLRVLEKIGLRRDRLLPNHLPQATMAARVDAWRYCWTRSAGTT